MEANSELININQNNLANEDYFQDTNEEFREKCCVTNVENENIETFFRRNLAVSQYMSMGYKENTMNLVLHPYEIKIISYNGNKQFIKIRNYSRIE